MSGYFIPMFSQYSWLILVLTQVFPPPSVPSLTHIVECVTLCCCCLLLSSPHRHISLLCWPRPPLQITEVRYPPPLGLGYSYEVENWGLPVGKFPFTSVKGILSVQFIMPVSFGVEPRSEGVMGSDFAKEISPCVSYRILKILINPELLLDSFF